MENFSNLLLVIISALVFTGCASSNRSMKTPNHHIEFYKDDFVYSEQVTGKATSIRVFGIDWERLFNRNSGIIDSDLKQNNSQNLMISGSVIAAPVIAAMSMAIPVIGETGKGRTSGYALYELMKNNPGYDIVIYPQYKTRRFLVPFIYSSTEVTVTARLARIAD